MKQKNARPADARRGGGIAEAIFDIVYLALAFGAGVALALREAFGQARMQQDMPGAAMLFGAACLVLSIGDAFHLVPRILGQLTGTMAERTHALGRGRQVTSITMTVFYLLLFLLWSTYLCAGTGARGAYVPGWLYLLAFVLSIARIVLCLFPQNGWTEQTPTRGWAIWRNVPFLLLGLLVAGVFAVSGAETMAKIYFAFLPLAVLLSFAFYLPVALSASKHPMLGMLMLPKTVMYLWIIWMGLRAFW